MKRLAIFVVLCVAFLGSNFERANAIDVVYAATSNGKLAKFQTDGTSLGIRPIPYAYSLAVDADRSIYVSPIGGQTVSRYDASGHGGAFVNPTTLETDSFVMVAGAGIGPDGNFYLGEVANPRRIERFDTSGNSLGMLQLPAVSSMGAPNAFDWDSSGRLFVAAGNRVVSFSADGTSSAVFATVAGLAGGIALDKNDNVYVVTTTSVNSYTPAGQLLNSFATDFYSVSAAFDRDDTLYVGGSSNSGASGVIRKYLTDGTLVGSFSGLPNLGVNNYVTGLVIVNDSSLTSLVPEPSAFILAMVASTFLPLSRRRRW